MSMNYNTTSNNQNWTTKKFTDFSRNLGQAYCPGLDKTQTNRKANSWTTEKFINMSRHLSSAYGVDF